MPRVIAIGDIHGCLRALQRLLQVVDPCASDLVVVLGDFIDQGNETRQVIDRLIELERQCRLVCLLGNHEEMLLAARESPEARKYWEICGGLATLNSYRIGARLDAIPANHFRFIDACRDFYEVEDHFFVHANYDPDQPLAEQAPHILRWELLDPATARPHKSGKRAIVGHTEQLQGDILDLGYVVCIDTACWRYGWLTAIEVNQGTVWQVNRFGALRT